MTSPECRHFCAIVPVWGRKYVDQFLNFGLPIQMIPESLPAFAKKHRVTYSIVSTGTDIQYMENHPAIRNLAQFVSIDFINFEGKVPGNLLSIYQMSAAYQLAIEKHFSQPNDVGFIFLTPDSVWSAGFLNTIDLALSEGKRAISLVGFRGAQEHFLKIFSERRQTIGFSEVLKPRSLVSIFNQCPHPLHMSMVWNQPRGNSMPASVIWPLEKSKGWFTRSYVYHPLFVFPKRLSPVCGYNEGLSSIDHAFVTAAGVSYDEIFVVTDSDQMVGIDLAPGEHEKWQITSKRLNEKVVVRWLLGEWCGPLQFFYTQFTVVIHEEDISSQEVQTLSETSKDIFDKIFSEYQIKRQRIFKAYPWKARAWKIKRFVAEATPMPIRRIYQGSKRLVKASFLEKAQ